MTDAQDGIFMLRESANGLEKAFCIDCGHAAGTNCGDSLAIGEVLNISAGEHAWHPTSYTKTSKPNKDGGMPLKQGTTRQ